MTTALLPFRLSLLGADPNTAPALEVLPCHWGGRRPGPHTLPPTQLTEVVVPGTDADTARARPACVAAIASTTTATTVTATHTHTATRATTRRRLPELSDDTLLQIMGLLGPVELCRLCRCCRRLNAVASTVALWRQLLLREMPRWPYVQSGTLPGHHAVWARPKRAFAQCCPPRAAAGASAAAAGPGVAGSLSLLLPARLQLRRRAPTRVVVFGPGLETVGEGLVMSIIWSPGSPFDVTGMTAGVGGFGGGVALKHRASAAPVDMIALYQKSWSQRRMAAADPKRPPAHNWELSRAGREVLATVDAFIFVADADQLGAAAGAKAGGGDGDGDGDGQQAALRDHLGQLRGMLSPEWASRTAPLLVLACSSTPCGGGGSAAARRERPPPAAAPTPAPAAPEPVPSRSAGGSGEPAAADQPPQSAGRARAAAPVELAHLLQLGAELRPWRVARTEVDRAYLHLNTPCRPPLPAQIMRPVSAGTQWLLGHCNA